MDNQNDRVDYQHPFHQSNRFEGLQNEREDDQDDEYEIEDDQHKENRPENCQKNVREAECHRKDETRSDKHQENEYRWENDLDNQNRLERQQSVEKEFMCGCCCELMVQPTTLTCGHSFCRLCLARWHTQSRKKTCPMCQQTFDGCPKINIIIKNLIEKSYKNELKEREADILTTENNQLITKFENSLKRVVATPVIKRTPAKDFCLGILVAGVVAVMGIYLFTYWGNSGSEMLLYKPPLRWSNDDVVLWLSELGSWTEEYREMAKTNQIDGRLLLALDESSIQSSLNLTNALHEKAIINSIEILRENNQKLPSTFWEYKSLHPGRTLFLVYGIKGFPRTTMLYLYMYDYDEVFLPFLHSTFPNTDTDDVLHSHKYDDPGLRQQLEYLSTFTLLPYWVIIKFSWSWYDVNFWIVLLVIVNCAASTFLEAVSLTKFLQQLKRDYKRTLKNSVKEYMKGILSMIFFAFIWPVVPSFICDIFFYVGLFFSPLHQLKECLKNELR